MCECLCVHVCAMERLHVWVCMCVWCLCVFMCMHARVGVYVCMHECLFARMCAGVFTRVSL